MEVGLVKSIDIDHEMQQAYLDYAMSVIVARALPDARDGLKPVHRRILYAMYDMGLRPETAHKKSARIVGEVLGKYHPHGDMAVYEAMARMAQEFSMRYMLVDGQGNFGSIDGDPPAAMRYTEARLASPAMNMLADIQRNTVNFNDNFDGTLKEPDVLPSAVPNLLVNGATGIAVGMSTSIPPHNLGEVVDALVYMLENWEQLDDLNVEDLMQFIQGPDFPTGGIIVQGSNEEEGITSAYGSGRGKVIVQARVHAEEMSRGRNRLIVTELPYMTNKASLIERIAELVREERLDGVADLRDESDRHGLRIVIELTKTADPEVVLRELFKSTPMRSTFGIIMLALVGGEPRTLSLKQALRVYLDHRLEVIRRRTEFDLEKAKARAHILEGLRIALKNLDEVIDLIRKSPDAETARTRLMKRFKLSEIQAQAILDMPLRRLAALERKKIEDEYKEVQALIKELEALLRSPKKMRQVVAEELLAVKEAYGDRRRTQILHIEGSSIKDIPVMLGSITPDRAAWITVTRDGRIYRTHGSAPLESVEAAPLHLLRANTKDTLYLVAENGEAAALPVHSIPEVESIADAAPVYKVSSLGENDRVAALFTLPVKEERPVDQYILTASRQGLIKKTAAGELPGPSAKSFTLMKINEGDRFGWAQLTGGKAQIFLATANGMAIRFSEDDVRPMGLVAAGVGAIKLQSGDELIGLELAPEKGDILFLCSDGKAKRVPQDQFPTQGRYGQGVQAWKLAKGARLVSILTAEGTGKGAPQLPPEMDYLQIAFENHPPSKLRYTDVPLQARAATGKVVIEGKPGELIVIGLVVPRDLSGMGWEEEPSGNGNGSNGKNHLPESNGRVSSNGKAAAAPEQDGSRRKPAMRAAEAPAPKPARKAAAAGKAKTAAKPETKKKTSAKTSAAKKPAVEPKTRKAAQTGPESAKPSTEKPAGKRAASTQPAAKETSGSKPAAEKPAAKKPATAKSSTAKAAPTGTAPVKPTPEQKTTKTGAKKSTPAPTEKSAKGTAKKSGTGETSQMELTIPTATPKTRKKSEDQSKPAKASSEKPAAGKSKPSASKPTSKSKPVDLADQFPLDLPEPKKKPKEKK